MATTPRGGLGEEVRRRWELTCWNKDWELEREWSSFGEVRRRPENWAESWDARDVEATAITTVCESTTWGVWERESQAALDLALCFAFCVFVCKMVRESFLRVVVFVAGWWYVGLYGKNQLVKWAGCFTLLLWVSYPRA